MVTKPKGGKGPTPPKKSTPSAEGSPTHPDDEVPPEKAQTKTASGSPPKQQNTTGQINKKTAAAPKSAPSNPKPDISKTHEYLDSVKPAEIRGESTKVIEQLKGATEAGDRVRATQAKDVLEGLKDKANKAGLGPKDVPELANYSAGQFLEIAGALMGGGRGRRKAPAVKTASGGGGKGGYGVKKAKRRPSRRCDLVPYDELECPPENHAHHVVPDFMHRTGNRKGTTGGRIPGATSLADGLAICLTDEEHKQVHQDDKLYKGASDSTRGGKVAGTITGKQAKTISASNVERVTRGKGGNSCSKKEIQEQLDKQNPDSQVLRGDKHPGTFNKRDGAAEAVGGKRGK